MQSVGTVLEEVAGGQLVGALGGNVGKVGVGGLMLDLEDEGWLEGGVATVGMTEEKTIVLHGIRG